MNEKNMKGVYSYHDYYVTLDGKIITKQGKEIRPKGSEQVLLTIQGKRKGIKRARVVYEAVTGKKTKRSDVFVFLDGNSQNPAFENIQVYSRKDYFNKVNTGMACKKAKLKPEQTQKIQSLCSKGVGVKKVGSPTYRELATQYGCSKSTILKILQRQYVYD